MASSTSHDGATRVRPMTDAGRAIARDPRLGAAGADIAPITPRGLWPQLVADARRVVQRSGSAAVPPLDADEAWTARALAELSARARGRGSERRSREVEARLAWALAGAVEIARECVPPERADGPEEAAALGACAWWVANDGATEDTSWDLAAALLEVAPPGSRGTARRQPRLNCVSLSVFVVLCARRNDAAARAGTAPWPLEVRATWAHAFVVKPAGPCAGGRVFETLHSAWYAVAQWQRMLELLGDFRPGVGLAGCRGLVETRTVYGLARVVCGAACAWAQNRGDAAAARSVVDWTMANAGAAESTDPWIVVSIATTRPEDAPRLLRRLRGAPSVLRAMAVHHGRALQLLSARAPRPAAAP